MTNPADVDVVFHLAALGIALVHVPRGERGEVKQDVDVGGEVVVEHRGLDELHVVVEILGRPEISVVDGDHVVIGREPVREVRADKARATRHENTLIVHKREILTAGELSLRFRSSQKL